jgi:hypothetical protein
LLYGAAILPRWPVIAAPQHPSRTGKCKRVTSRFFDTIFQWVYRAICTIFQFHSVDPQEETWVFLMICKTWVFVRLDSRSLTSLTSFVEICAWMNLCPLGLRLSWTRTITHEKIFSLKITKIDLSQGSDLELMAQSSANWLPGTSTRSQSGSSDRIFRKELSKKQTQTDVIIIGHERAVPIFTTKFLGN